jgi:imidazolonepropionase-like amidohydrolase
MHEFRARFVTLVTAAALTLAASSALAKPIVLRAARMFDGKGDAVVAPGQLVVDGNKLVAVGNKSPAPAGAEVIDLGDVTLLPGLMDAHTHLTGEATNDWNRDELDGFKKEIAQRAIEATVYANRTLLAGFTMVRDLGSDHFIDVGLRNAIDAGKIPGPRMLVAGNAIGARGGHCDDGAGYRQGLLKESDFTMGVADGADQIRSAVRYTIMHGASVVKTCASGGVLSLTDNVDSPQLTQAELDALVDEAHALGRKAAAHAHGAEAAKRALRAGIDSIEHGSLIDDEGIRLMKEHGTYLVADIYNDDYILAEYTRLGYPQKIIDKERQVGRLQRENFKKAVQAGVKIAYGTDAGVYPHGWNAKQFAHMVRWGTTPMQAIQAATVNAADLLGWADKVGALEPGKYADVIAVPGDPLQDVTVLEHVAFVMKGGQVVKDSLTGGARAAR